MTQPGPLINAETTDQSRLRQAFGLLLDLLLPPRCLRCGEVVVETGVICGVCWPEMHFISRPSCAACGIPFETDPGPGALCGACTADRPPYDRARAVFVYDDASRQLVFNLKYRDGTDIAPALGGWLARAGAEQLAAADLVVPVPLHWTRLFMRRFNQSALLAQALSQRGEVAFVPDLLIRTRATPSQTGLGFLGRNRNVRGAFRVKAKRRDILKGRRVLLIDDVFTTGSTVNACVRALLKSGAAAVDVLTLARVVRPRRVE